MPTGLSNRAYPFLHKRFCRASRCCGKVASSNLDGPTKFNLCPTRNEGPYVQPVEQHRQGVAVGDEDPWQSETVICIPRDGLSSCYAHLHPRIVQHAPRLGRKTAVRKAEAAPVQLLPRQCLRSPDDLGLLLLGVKLAKPGVLAGGPGNPLGARVMELDDGKSRINGTNAPATIGTNVIFGCVRLGNDDVVDLYGRVQNGTAVVVN